MDIANIEKLAALVVDAGFKLHRDLGPGLLESAYELILLEKLPSLSVEVDRQVPINIDYDGLRINQAFRINFGTPTFKDGIRRLVNNHQDFASSRLRANN